MLERGPGVWEPQSLGSRSLGCQGTWGSPVWGPGFGDPRGFGVLGDLGSRGVSGAFEGPEFGVPGAALINTLVFALSYMGGLGALSPLSDSCQSITRRAWAAQGAQAGGG